MRSFLPAASAVIALSSFGGLQAAAQSPSGSPVETKQMPNVEAKQTTVFLLPTVGENNNEGGRLKACDDEMRSQFTQRGFQLKEAASGAAAPADFSVPTNRSVENLVQVGRDAQADFVCFMVVEKVKTFKFYEIPRNPFHQYFDRLWLRREYVGPIILTEGFSPIPFTLPNNKWGATVHTYLIEVRSGTPVLFNHKTYGNSEGFMLGRSKSKVGPRGSVQDAAMFILSRTLKDYKQQ